MQGLRSLGVSAPTPTAPRGEAAEIHLGNRRVDRLDEYLGVALLGLNVSDDLMPSGPVQANVGTMSMAPDPDYGYSFWPGAATMEHGVYRAMLSNVLVTRARQAAATKALEVLARNLDDPVDDTLLMESLAKLDSVNETGETQQAAVENARSLLPELYRIYPTHYLAEPSERNGVTLSPPMKDGAAVSIDVDADGVVYCFASIHGNLRRAKYFQMDGLPDGFIAKALRDLAEAE